MNVRLAHAIERAAHLLPAQGPITVFIHHNTLHALEHLPFERAVVEGGRGFGCEPYMSEERYREELRRGRVLDGDLHAVLAEELGAAGATTVGGFVARETLRAVWLRHGVPQASGQALDWLLRETDVLERLRPDVPPAARARIVGPHPASRAERRQVRELWEACRAAVRGVAAPSPALAPRLVRHRDLLLAVSGRDSDALVHPLLIRLSAAYLDQGLASWSLPARERGFYRSVVELYARRGGSPDPYLRAVRRLFVEEARAGSTGHVSLERSLERLGVPAEEWEEFLVASALALRGWAGMMRQIEERPDRVPVHAPPAGFADFLAIRLLLERAALETLEAGVDLARLRPALAARLVAPQPPALAERAWPLFHLAQLLGHGALDVAALDAASIAEWLAEIDAFDDLARRRLLHLAYERRLRHRLYDALAAHRRREGPAPRFQAVFCIDEREESIRRHLEEVAPECETFGAAGFFGVAMYYRGAEEAHARPLCPVGVRPEHEVEERPLTEIRSARRLRERMRRAAGRVGLDMAVGSRTLVRGTLGTVLLGALASLPLLFRVLFPRLAARLRRTGRRLLGGAEARRLVLERRDVAPSLGRHSGFTTDEMATIVRRLLEETGLARHLAPLVLVLGHGSTSLNNPHESAHDCGACGGGRGGPNARALAQMANHPAVRRRLAEAGVPIPETTWFVGAEHNTANDALAYFDLDQVPQLRRPLLAEARVALDRSRRRDAHERCRRFDSVPAWYPPRLALAHVETRAEDLAQPRPEYGHATNAFCVVGRRSRTRGLFLDRRAFLVSYDPAHDDAQASVLARVLQAVVPVVSGISLEYYFGYVDPAGYGCGTKLPHNVTALLGVMDGHASDLRTGLPWQMVDVHEPVRLTLVVETTPETLGRLIGRDAALERLVSNRWIFVATLAPETDEIHELGGSGFLRHGPASGGTIRVPDSASWYRGRRGHLDFAEIGSAEERRA